MRQVKSAIIIAPVSGSGQHVFRPEARRLAALYDIPESRIILFDQKMRPAKRFAFVCAAVAAIVAALPPGEVIDAIIILCHGWATGDQIGITIANLPVFFASFAGRLAVDVVLSLNSCSNGADTRVGPGGDGSFADRARDVMCSLGFVRCRATGHLAPGHATQFPFVRFFDGDGTRNAQQGGYGIVSRADPLFATWRAELRKAVDPDGPGPEPMTSLRWTYWTMSRDEILARLRETTGLVVATHRSEPPSWIELQQALDRGGFAPGDLDGVPGRRTTAAVKAFQRAHPPLKVDGDPGPKTWAALRAAGLLDAQAA